MEQQKDRLDIEEKARMEEMKKQDSELQHKRELMESRTIS